ncbi:MAG: hypothetical protein WCA12_02760 [Burkholderiales bacterium]
MRSLVLGRELGATFYGYGFTNSLLAPSVTPGGDARVVDFKSTFFDLPILEYRPYGAFDTKQSSAVLIQLLAGADVPHGATSYGRQAHPRQSSRPSIRSGFG